MIYHEQEVFRSKRLSEERVQNQEFVECRFEDCEFQNLHLHTCKFVDCVFVGTRVINPVFDHCTMTGSSFGDCRLLGVNWGALSAGFVAPIAGLDGCQLKYNNFVNFNFPQFSFAGNGIQDSMFADCNLLRSSFSGCQLERTEFFRCDLREANFEQADGYTVDLDTCKLKGAAFSFPQVVNLLSGLGIVIK